MQVMHYQEGYVDGLAGAGMQNRMGIDAVWYYNGFEDGSLDRKVMLAQRERIAGFTSIDDWLREEGIADQVNASAAERVRQLEQREREGA